ncbi:MAG: hypothetical protein ACI4LP_00045 [Anaerovoracaceae bacterium]
MTSAEKAYTSDYSYIPPSAYAREYAQQFPERKSYPQKGGDRTSEHDKERKIREVQHTQPKSPVSRAVLVRSVILLVIAGILLVGTVWMSAKATEIKYSINKTNKEIRTIENEITALKVKIEGANGIESVEEYAINKLKMKYPTANQCIYIEEDAVVRDTLSAEIREKAYGKS